jgi:hypothetical protein
MSGDSKECGICGTMRDELGDRTFQYVIAGARLQASVDEDQFPRLKSEIERTQAEYSDARENLIRHYQERHPIV